MALLLLQLTETPSPSRSLLLMEFQSRSRSLLLIVKSPIRSRSDHLLRLGLDLKLDTSFLLVRRSRGSCRVRSGNIIGECIHPIVASSALLQRTVAPRSSTDHLLWLGLDLKLEARFLLVRHSRGSCRVRTGNVIG